MNFQNLNFDYVEPPHEHRPFNFELQSSRRNSDLSQDTIVNEREPDQIDHLGEPAAAVLTSQLPATPSQRPHVISAPTPPYSSTSDGSSELYGPERLFGTNLNPPPPAAFPLFAPRVHFDEAQLEMDAREAALNQQMLTGFREQLVLEAGKVTPGVDDTPYLQYALEAITRSPQDYTPHSSDDSYSIANATPAPALLRSVFPPHQDANVNGPPGVPPPATPLPMPPVARKPELVPPPTGLRPTSLAATLTPALESQASVSSNEMPDGHAWAPFEPRLKGHLVDLDYKPLLLRPVILLLSAVLLLAIMALLIFCAIYSMQHQGLVEYSGSIYGGQWFLFRILPQLVGVFVLLYAQATLSTLLRIQPFRMLASDIDEVRSGAFLREMYPTSYMLPQISGPWDVSLPAFIIWLTSFTVPLLSSLFTVVLVDGTWRWNTVQGVAWTIVALYILLVGAYVVLFISWYHAWTGLQWDPRSLADIINIAARSNNMGSFEGLDVAAGKNQFVYALGQSADKLTWWQDGKQPQSGRWWYSLGLSGNQLSSQRVPFRKRSKQYISSNETLNAGAKAAGTNEVRYRYIPWCSRTSQLVLFSAVAWAILIALFVISFFKQTSLKNGFTPGLSAGPQAGAFSPANFVYTFVPSLIGLIGFHLFQGLELTWRILTPWGELGRQEGATAQDSLAVDYAACGFTLEAAIKALMNKHWRLAAISTIASLFVLLPVLGGGVFMALTRTDDGIVRIYPNFAAYGVLLAVLVLYALALAAVIPDRARFHLPHEVTTLAEVLSFCQAQELRDDPAFANEMDFDHRGEWSGSEKRNIMMEGLGIGVGLSKNRMARWVFGMGDAGHMGIIPLRRFTEKSAAVGGLGHSRKRRQETMMRVMGQENWGRRVSDIDASDYV